MDLIKKLKAGASKAADVAQQTMDITKLAAQIAARKRDLGKNMTLIGRQVYDAYKAGDLSRTDKKIDSLCKASEALEDEIASLERQLKRLRNEKVCACGKISSKDTKFCPDCGRSLSGAADVITIKARPVDDSGNRNHRDE